MATQSKNTTLCVRFVGSELAVEPVPIEQLAHVLLAVQRLAYKCDLYAKERLGRAAAPSLKVREENALTLLQIRKSPFEVVLGNVPGDRAVQMLTALSIYGRQELEPGKGSTTGLSHNVSEEFIGAIYPQVVSLTRRIDNIGGILRLEFYAEGIEAHRVTFDAATKDYVRDLGKELPGFPYEITGTVKSILLDREEVVIDRDPDAHDVKIRFSSKANFEKVKGLAHADMKFTFKGRSIHRLGIEALEYREFDCDEVRFPSEPDLPMPSPPQREVVGV